MQVDVGSGRFTFDFVYEGADGYKNELYDECVRSKVEGLYQGYNSTVRVGDGRAASSHSCWLHHYQRCVSRHLFPDTGPRVRPDGQRQNVHHGNELHHGEPGHWRHPHGDAGRVQKEGDAVRHADESINSGNLPLSIPLIRHKSVRVSLQSTASPPCADIRPIQFSDQRRGDPRHLRRALQGGVPRPPLRRHQERRHPPRAQVGRLEPLRGPRGQGARSRALRCFPSAWRQTRLDPPSAPRHHLLSPIYRHPATTIHR